MTLKDALKQAGLSYRKAAEVVGISKTAATRAINGEGWPRQRSGPARTALEEELAKRGVAVGLIDWDAVMHEHKGAGPPVGKRRPETVEEGTLEVELMQMDREVLKHFGLRRNPFSGDIVEDADVWQFHGLKAVEESITDAVEECGFLAVVAESGAGKTTIMEGIEGEMMAREDVIWSKPHLLERDRLQTDHLTYTLIRDIAGESEKIRPSMELRSRQAGELIASAYQQRKRVVLYIDDAHFCSTAVLRQLKRFYELKTGRFRMLCVILVGLPELMRKLGTFEEIGNRIRMVQVPLCPVDEYLTFKLGRAGSDPLKMFDEQGWTAFLDRFRPRPRAKSVSRPLVINATCIRAMVALHRSGAAPGERIGREIVDMLPGTAARRLG